MSSDLSTNLPETSKTPTEQALRQPAGPGQVIVENVDWFLFFFFSFVEN